MEVRPRSGAALAAGIKAQASGRGYGPGKPRGGAQGGGRGCVSLDSAFCRAGAKASRRFDSAQLLHLGPGHMPAVWPTGLSDDGIYP